MSDSYSYPGPVLESYSVESPRAARSRAAEASEVPQEWKIVLRGKNFFERAMMPVIMIGDMRVQYYEITPDGSSIICYLSELPEEGAEISITFEPGKTATLPEKFSRSRATPSRGDEQ